MLLTKIFSWPVSTFQLFLACVQTLYCPLIENVFWNIAGVNNPSLSLISLTHIPVAPFRSALIVCALDWLLLLLSELILQNPDSFERHMYRLRGDGFVYTQLAHVFAGKLLAVTAGLLLCILPYPKYDANNRSRYKGEIWSSRTGMTELVPLTHVVGSLNNWFSSVNVTIQVHRHVLQPRLTITIMKEYVHP